MKHEVLDQSDISRLLIQCSLTYLCFLSSLNRIIWKFEVGDLQGHCEQLVSYLCLMISMLDTQKEMQSVESRQQPSKLHSNEDLKLKMIIHVSVMLQIGNYNI